jgi:hypothetical protein
MMLRSPIPLSAAQGVIEIDCGESVDIGTDSDMSMKRRWRDASHECSCCDIDCIITEAPIVTETIITETPSVRF